MADDLRQQLLDGRLWAAFCDQLKAAGERILDEDVPLDPRTRAEGVRYLARLTRLALEKNIEFANPDYPQFYSLSHETAKIGNDNPDNLYLNCAIDGSRDYLITGSRGSVPYVSIETKAGSYGATGDMAPTGHVSLDDLTLAPDGSFELVVSATPQTGNWLPMRADSDNILVRQTFHDRAAEQPAALQISCLNPRGSARLDPDQFAAQLTAAPRFVAGTAGLFVDWMRGFGAHLNQLPANDQQVCLAAGGDPSIHYHNSRWRLAEDEALLVEFRPPAACRTWNFQLSNYWMESLDYRYHRIWLNAHSAVTDEDGLVRIVVAHDDPGSAWPNWVTTTGLGEGAMLLRYVEASDFPPVHTRVVTFSELARMSPGGEQ
jgi:hypothetical protein